MNQQTEGMLGRNFEELSNQRTPLLSTNTIHFSIQETEYEEPTKVEGKRRTGNDNFAIPTIPELDTPLFIFDGNKKTYTNL